MNKISRGDTVALNRPVRAYPAGSSDLVTIPTSTTGTVKGRMVHPTGRSRGFAVSFGENLTSVLVPASYLTVVAKAPLFEYAGGHWPKVTS